MISEESVKEVLARADIAQVVGDYVRLKRAGHSLKGLCPFHGEKTPSFHVTPAKGLFYCFGCGQGGTAIDFMMRMEGLSFPEAVELLGSRFGVEIAQVGQRSEEFRSARQRRESLLQVLEVAARYFRENLQGASGEAGRRYLSQRGLGDEVAAHFALGLALPAWGGLEGHLRSQRVEMALAVELGLIVERSGEGGRGHYDRFRERLIFPVQDSSGRVIAFGGRALGADTSAKYINSPESALYVKGRNLFGLFQAREALRRDERVALLVEGNIDVLTLHQAGYRHAVATMGTALTPEQAQLLARYAEKVVVLFDGDKAGRRAAYKALGPLLAHPLETSVALLPDDMDPDAFVRIYGREGLEEILASAEALPGWCVSEACAEIMAAPLELREQAMGPLGELLRLFPAGTVQRHFAQEASRLLGLELTAVVRGAGLDLGPAGGAVRPALKLAVVPASASAVVDPVEGELLQLLLDAPERLLSFVAADGLLLIEDGAIRRLIEALVPRVERGVAVSRALEEIEDDALRRMALGALVGERVVEAPHVEDWYRGAIARLTERWVERQIGPLGMELQEAIRGGNAAKSQELMQRYTELQRLRLQAREERKINWGAHQSGDAGAV